jgi:hypothetical protein
MSVKICVSWTWRRNDPEPLMVGSIASAPSGMNAEASKALQSQERNSLRVRRRTIVIDLLSSFFRLCDLFPDEDESIPFSRGALAL